jgi:hypothetical protein
MKKPFYNLDQRNEIYKNNYIGKSLLIDFYVYKIKRDFILFFEPICLPIINFLNKILTK